VSVLRDVTIALRDHAKRTGKFSRVNGHEYKHAPGAGLSATVWFDRMVPASSGMAATSVCVVMQVRIYAPVQREGQSSTVAMAAQDELDPEIMDAVSALCAAYAADFTLGDMVRSVDLRGGESGVQLETASGYADIDRVLHRIVTITVPLVVNDLWPESA
jgi:hypothetical protein